MDYDLKILLNAPDGDKLIKKVEAGEMTKEEALFQAARVTGIEKVARDRGAKFIADAANKKRKK